MRDNAPKSELPLNDSVQLTVRDLFHPVSILLNRDITEITDCSIAPVRGGVGIGNAVYRLSGTAHHGGRRLQWRLILKVLRPQGGFSRRDSYRYFRREAEIYECDLLERLTEGVTVPRVYGVVDRSDGSCLLWLEEVHDDMGTGWPLEHYGLVARHLGRLNGRFLANRSLGERSYLSRGWLRSVVEDSAPGIELLRESADHPLVRRWFPNGAYDRLFQLWEDRNAFLDVLDGRPQTFCHLDAFRRNIVARESPAGGYESILLDWAFSGVGAIGEEIVPLVFASIMFFELDPEVFEELEELVLSGYRAGLADVGRRLDPRQIRLGYAAASLRYLLGDLSSLAGAVLDEARHSVFPVIFGRSVTECIDRAATVYQQIFRLTSEVGALLDALG